MFSPGDFSLFTVVGLKVWASERLDVQTECEITASFQLATQNWFLR